MRIQDELDQLSQIVSNDKISDLSKSELERYSNALCFSAAFSYFSSTQFSQVCETIRLLLLKKYLEENDRKNTFLQYIVIVLMALTIFMAGIQCYVMLKPNSQTVKQIELLQNIKSQLSENQHQKSNSSDKK